MAEAAPRRTPLQGFGANGAWPELFAGVGVTLREVPFVTQVNVRGNRDLANVPALPNTTASIDGWTALWLGPDEWLLVDPDGEAPAIEERVRGAFAAPLPRSAVEGWDSVVDVSAHRTVLELRGPAAPEVLQKGCPLDLHPRVFGRGACAQTLLAKAQVILWQRDDEPNYWIFVRASFATYVAEWLLDALSEFRAAG